MNKLKWVTSIAAIILMGSTAGFLARLRTHQSLGPPGVKTSPLPGTIRVRVDLPEQVLDYRSKLLEADSVATNTLPSDTSFGQRHYEAADGFQLNLSVVLMGTDRTSLHKPQFCLTGSGWRIDQSASAETTVHLDQPISYDLQVVKLIASPEPKANGQRPDVRAVYVYWFVAGDALSAGLTGFERMWMMAAKLLRTGILQRWAYVSCLAYCAPGQEEPTFERIKRFIAAAAPQFQLMPPSGPPPKPRSQILPAERPTGTANIHPIENPLASGWCQAAPPPAAARAKRLRRRAASDKSGRR